jgi:hypothetical protein
MRFSAGKAVTRCILGRIAPWRCANGAAFLPLEARMKKSKTRDQEQNRKPRLSLSRETLRFLDDPALLGLAGAGGTYSQTQGICVTLTDPTSGSC